uniref:Uncharacterized protein n=1 Tax=Trichogramma kaykai TaxID=54128 RepID=A0ABD2XH01_9HYME
MRIIKRVMENSINLVLGNNEEPSDTRSNAGDGYALDSVDYCKDKKVETLPFYELSVKHENENVTLQERLDKNIIIDFECKDVKLEVPSLWTTICKSEYPSRQEKYQSNNDYKEDRIFRTNGLYFIPVNLQVVK